MRSPISAIPAERLMDIQNGTMRYSWRGILCNKSPFDFALYSLLLWQVKPATIFEIGSKQGGSALWLADTCRTQCRTGSTQNLLSQARIPPD